MAQTAYITPEHPLANDAHTAAVRTHCVLPGSQCSVTPQHAHSSTHKGKTGMHWNLPRNQRWRIMWPQQPLALCAVANLLQATVTQPPSGPQRGLHSTKKATVQRSGRHVPNCLRVQPRRAHTQTRTLGTSWLEPITRLPCGYSDTTTNPRNKP
jgi:hypothetical protein